jgi:hypothetical protein
MEKLAAHVGFRILERDNWRRREGSNLWPRIPIRSDQRVAAVDSLTATASGSAESAALPLSSRPPMRRTAARFLLAGGDSNGDEISLLKIGNRIDVSVIDHYLIAATVAVYI